MTGAAREAGLSHTFIRDIFNGKVASPGTAKLEKLAKVLNTSLAWLATGLGEEDLSAEQVEFERVKALLKKVDPNDLPNVARAIRGFIREEEEPPLSSEKSAAPKSKRP